VEHAGQEVETALLKIGADLKPGTEAEIDVKVQDLGQGLEEVDVESLGLAAFEVLVGRIVPVCSHDDRTGPDSSAPDAGGGGRRQDSATEKDRPEKRQKKTGAFSHGITCLA
jgi:hypothetical protein